MKRRTEAERNLQKMCAPAAGAHYMGEGMRVAYVTSYDPNDRGNWSGLGYAIMHALKRQGLDVVSIGPLANNFEQIGRIKERLYSRFNRSYDFQRSAILGHDYARQVKWQLRKCAYDIVFSPSTIPISRLRCHEPIAIWVDATWASFLPLYERRPPWCKETIREGHITERLAYDRCCLIIFTSQWAADSAVKDYGIDPKKVLVIPFGANFNNDIDCARALHSISERPTGRCQLISIGVEWHRKGMSRSVDLAAACNSADLPTELTIVGCEAPPSTRLPSFVKVEGFIDKGKPEGEERLSSLLLQSHFHVLFSTGDCSPVVFSEANAHAVPNITCDIGGIPSIVVNDRGGRCFNPHQPSSDIAAYIKSYILDRDRYAVLARAARQEYDERLNWAVAGARVKKNIEAAIRNGGT